MERTPTETKPNIVNPLPLPRVEDQPTLYFAGELVCGKPSTEVRPEDRLPAGLTHRETCPHCGGPTYLEQLFGPGGSEQVRVHAWTTDADRERVERCLREHRDQTPAFDPTDDELCELLAMLPPEELVPLVVDAAASADRQAAEAARENDTDRAGAFERLRDRLLADTVALSGPPAPREAHQLEDVALALLSGVRDQLELPL